MRLPGLDTIAEGVGKVIRRFPFAMLMAFVGTLTAYFLIHIESLENEYSLYRLLMTAVLGFLLFLVIQLKLEREKFKGKTVYLVKLIGALFLLLYYWQLPNDFDYASQAFIIRFFLLGLTLLFSLTFIPFVRHFDEVNGFWQYCKTLFIRLFLTFVFTGSLYLGLVLALVGIKELLGVDFDEKLFLEMWVMIVGLVSTSFFLSGIPEKTSVLEKKKDYHKGIQVFAEYILTPLILVYALILYIYTGKILLHWDWPEGMVSWLIIVFSVATILANFMLHPLAEKASYVKKFRKISYALIIPMTVVMFMALKIRVDEYGVTEPRYYGMVVCFWFLVMSLYFILSKKKNLLIIPLSLSIITLVSSAGPLSSMNISKYSQMTRLKAVLTQYNILVDGRVIKTDQELPNEDVRIIDGALSYLYRVHGIEVFQPWFEESLENLDNCWGGRCVMKKMGITYGEKGDISVLRSDVPRYKSFYVDGMESFDIRGYSSIIPMHLSKDREFKMEDMTISLSQKPFYLTYRKEDGTEIMIPLDLFMETKLTEGSQGSRTREQMRIDQADIGIVFDNFDILTDRNDRLEEIRFLSGYLLIR